MPESINAAFKKAKYQTLAMGQMGILLLEA